ncbi:Flp family type IVb pilin [Massilia sp. Root418]|jgi:pilus assembly protein Flp/PilA|uniref:Flp family type IVb pilin n=1 Tax=Massilia sp. Root418 TaxID=1736532 RepID=UPI0009E84543|nr:Flp family type IVb pilin [Massilia sp. Root418]
MQRLLSFFQNTSAVTAIEYALLASLIAGVVIVGATAFGDALGQLYTYARDLIVLALQ